MGDGVDDLLGENQIEFFGSDVALSADGNALAVGAVGQIFARAASMSFTMVPSLVIMCKSVMTFSERSRATVGAPRSI